jgi:hypothetical protein
MKKGFPGGKAYEAHMLQDLSKVATKELSICVGLGTIHVAQTSYTTLGQGEGPAVLRARVASAGSNRALAAAVASKLGFTPPADVMKLGGKVKVREWKDTTGLTQLRSHCQETLGKVLFRLSQHHDQTPAAVIGAVLSAQDDEAALVIGAFRF